MLRRARLWLPPLVYMAVIFAFSAQSNPLPEITAHVWDKLLHTAEYVGLSFLLLRALRGEGLAWLAALATAVMLTSAYGATDEYHQSFVPGRDSSVFDWIADSTGAVIGATAYLVTRRIAESSNS